VELTASEYEAAASAKAVLVRRLLKREEHAIEGATVSQAPAAEEERRMRKILKHMLITPRNYLRVAARIVPQDQREAIRPGIIISHYSFPTSGGQYGYLIVSHTTQRAGICFAAERSEW
jgi:hypothetical protein